MSATGSISVKRFTGSVELRAWFEADPDDPRCLHGMSMAIARDSEGNITDVNIEATGVIVHV